MLLATYGTLRLNQSNYNYHLKGKSRWLGTTKTKPIYTMYNLGGFPGICKNGTTAIVLDVFDITQETLRQIDFLENYREFEYPEYSMYLRELIQTEFGSAFIYFFNEDVSEDFIIESGDWLND